MIGDQHEEERACMRACVREFQSYQSKQWRGSRPTSANTISCIWVWVLARENTVLMDQPVLGFSESGLLQLLIQIYT